jgi:uncharacterized membrane protein YeaQ/YmgE (transglycosylase-associated protein family)
MTDPPGDLRLGAHPEPSRPQRRQPPGHVGLRPASDLPSKAKLFLVMAGLIIIGFTGWVAVRLLNSDSRPVAILLIVLGCIGAGVVGIAVLTATRMLFSLRAMPYLLGRLARGLLTRRRV